MDWGGRPGTSPVSWWLSGSVDWEVLGPAVWVVWGGWRGWSVGSNSGQCSLGLEPRGGDLVR